VRVHPVLARAVEPLLGGLTRGEDLSGAGAMSGRNLLIEPNLARQANVGALMKPQLQTG